MSRRRNSTFIDEYIQGTLLNRQEQMELQGVFKRTPQINGGVTFYDFFNILKGVYHLADHRRNDLLRWISQKEIRVLDFGSLVWAANLFKKQIEEANSQKVVYESEHYNSFVALGGNVDKSGFVSRDTLMKTIIDEFGVEMDVQSTIEGLQGLDQQRLSYDDFCDLFKTQAMRSQWVQIQDTRTLGDLMKTVKVSMEAFDDYLLKTEASQL